ncbi:MAG: bifunctional metallophosphatase/5'-nucleotidase [Saccharofermentans sp.]|nr:bifunctional metallophosphatase/5'-nucleotidase [Saccharofermentans sp.]
MNIRKTLAAFTAVSILFACASCAADNPWGQIPSGQDPDHIEISLPEMAAETEETVPVETEPVVTTAAPNGETYILFTSDVHCGVDAGFGYAGLAQIRDDLEAQGYQVILVDDGDFLQGAPIGSVDQGESIIEIMNQVGYDIVIPGNHDFDYGVDRLLELVSESDFEYLSCNFTHEDELVFAPYTIVNANGIDIAFVGVTTPKTISTVRPAFFQDDDGEYIYGFMEEDQTGEAVYEAVQNAVDEAREEGADLVYLMAHLGNQGVCSPWTYADVLSNTTGIDVCLDGHSHDDEQVVMLNADGEEVTRSAVGYRMDCIGYSHIGADGEIIETGIWTWTNTESAPDLLNITNDTSVFIEEIMAQYEDSLNVVIGTSSVNLTINDPNVEDEEGNPVRMVRRAETNLGDFCADAMRDQSGADIALLTGGSVRTDVGLGDVTYGDLADVFPFGDDLVIVEMTGQQILDALEWGARALPDEAGAFLQVSGLSYEVDVSVESGCVSDEDNCLQSIVGDRRVSNVMVGDDPIDENATYTVCIQDYLIDEGDGFTMFAEGEIINDSVILDLQALINYLTETLGGEIGEQYADPYGQGRIVINE